jgi:hypothetical protein
MRSFTLNSREFYEAVSEPRDPWRWGPGLPSERTCPQAASGPCIMAESDDAAVEAFAGWQANVDARRIGGGR